MIYSNYYEHLINLQEGGIQVNRHVNIESLDDINDQIRGIEVCKEELKLMLSTANSDQKSIYDQLLEEMKINSVAFVSGAAGTGKSFILRMLERHYKIEGYKVRYIFMTRKNGY